MFKGVRDLWRREFFPFFFLSIDKFFADFLPFPRFFFVWLLLFPVMTEELEDCIVRPPRATYTTDELVGGPSGKFAVGLLPGSREDFELTNKRGEKLKCSYYKPVGPRVPQELPCVIYCHCNSGSRVDANEVVSLIVPCGTAVLALDFAGSGHSDGEYVSLGVKEVDDVEAAVHWLRERGRSPIAMWGRSMGAVICLLYGQRDPTIAGIVMDSPFSNLVTLMEELAVDQGLRMPKYMLKSLISFLRYTIRKKCQFDIYQSDPLSAAQSSFIPALFGHGKEDDFIAFEHSEKLFKAYAGDKNLISFEGNHNSVRPTFFNTSVMIFLHNVLQRNLSDDPAQMSVAGSFDFQSGYGMENCFV